MKQKLLLLFFCLSIIIGCQEKSYKPIDVVNRNLVAKKVLSIDDVNNWYLKDVINDSLPGISYYRAKDSLLKNRRGVQVVVALIDSEVDVNHKDLNGSIWINNDEIPNNGIDDDKNGYIDDINGWNFLGNKKLENANFTSYSYLRVIRKYQDLFSHKIESEVSSSDSINYNNYKRAIFKYNQRKAFAEKDTAYANMLLSSLANVHKILTPYFKNSNFSLSKLDSLKQQHLKNKELQRSILIKSNFIKYGYSYEFMTNYKIKASERIKKLLNLKFNEREIQGDDPEDINDVYYGNNKIDGNLNLFHHGTELAGVISSLEYNRIKIMPVVISPQGDEHDKDIAVAIKYAVDNGAKVINLSFGKEFSLNIDWVFNALKYAESKNVLVVSSSGNSSYNLNKKNDYYPNDNYYNGKEVSDNFLLVGSITKNLNKKFKANSSNYGNIDVDIFAPGQKISTLIPGDKSKMDSGTSLASALTSGVAAIIYSYYPNLKASDVKKIIIDSGLKYNLEVEIREKGVKKSVNFSTLSKSGRVVNVYNALLEAEKYKK